MNVIIIGPQGSGKGTQAEYLIKNLGLTHIEMGKLIRQASKKHTKKALIIDHLVNQKGVLLPDGTVLDIIAEFLDTENAESLLFDGFPRTPGQYEALKQLLANRNTQLDAAIYLSIPDKESIKRLSSRRMCDVCGKTYSIDLEPNRKNCDCQGKLIVRKDDTPEAISRRLEAFHEQTDSVLKALEADGLLIRINGAASIDSISSQIISKLSNYSTSSTNISPNLINQKLKPTYKLIGFLAFILAILAGIRFIFTSTPQQNNIIPPPAPTLSPIPVSPTPAILLPQILPSDELEWKPISTSDRILTDGTLITYLNGEEIILDINGQEFGSTYSVTKPATEILPLLFDSMIERLEADGWSSKVATFGAEFSAVALNEPAGRVMGWVKLESDNLLVSLLAVFFDPQSNSIEIDDLGLPTVFPYSREVRLLYSDPIPLIDLIEN